MPHLAMCRECPCRDKCSEEMTCNHPELWADGRDQSPRPSGKNEEESE